MRCDVMKLGTRMGRELLWEQVPVLGFPQLGFGSSTVLEELCTAAGGVGEAAAAGAMPPKPAAAKGGKEKSKADLAKKQKLVEDKTFGLKNKNKSKNVQKFVQSLTQSVQPNPKQTDAKAALKKKKEEESAREKELNELFKVAISQPKVPLGVDPKSIVCEFYRHGQCAKGFKCKFSHDLSVERKGEKIDIYSDQRDGDVDTMDDWDQEKLEKVVESKGMEYSNNKPTEIVCKHFLEAVEKKQYGWFWVCPNGGKDCHYRHALPPGYVLKSQMKALLEEEGEKMSIEEEIEQERSATKSSTPITTELFLQWKREKQAKREAELSAKRAERAKNDRMSGRELFLADASLFVDDAEAFDHYEREEEEIPSSQLSRPPEEAKESSIKDGVGMTEDDEKLLAEDDDELDLDDEELDELEASVSKTSLHDT